MVLLDDLNARERGDFVAALADIFEHGAFVAEAAEKSRPFPTVSALHEAMAAAVGAAGRDRQLALLRGHPELAGRVARRGEMTAASQAEQGALGLDRLSGEEYETFLRRNASYREKFGFPFIICVRRHTRDSILDQFARRIENHPDVEFATALREVGLIARLRLAARVDGPGQLKVDGRLSTHVLDTSAGRPAGGMTVALSEVGASGRGILVTAATNADGRTEQPLIAGEPLRIGTYELQFAVGDYFRFRAVTLADPPFLDVVTVRFAIAEPEGNYHVPLLVTPWSYATYRGS